MTQQAHHGMIPTLPSNFSSKVVNIVNEMMMPSQLYQNGLKGKSTRLKHQSEQFWVAEKHTKGGGLTNNSHCKLRNLVALRGQNFKKNGHLRIQGRMQIFEKNVADGFKSRFDTVER